LLFRRITARQGNSQGAEVVWSRNAERLEAGLPNVTKYVADGLKKAQRVVERVSCKGRQTWRKSVTGGFRSFKVR
jgi:selenocysteine lyase/cysteine desulfurase